MKKQLSVFMLIVRYSVYPVLTVLGAMVLVQVGMFYCLGAGESTLSDALSEIPVMPVVCSALVVLSIILCRALCDKGGRLNNLVLRLGTSEKLIYLWQAVYNTMVFGLFFMAEALTLLLLSFLYASANPGTVEPIDLLVTAYRNPMFHTFFPLENFIGWFGNGVLILGLGVCCAAFPMRQRHRKLSMSTWFMVAAVIGYLFLQEEGANPLLGENLILPLIAAFFCMMMALAGVLMMEVEDDGKA